MRKAWQIGHRDGAGEGRQPGKAAGGRPALHHRPAWRQSRRVRFTRRQATLGRLF